MSIRKGQQRRARESPDCGERYRAHLLRRSLDAIRVLAGFLKVGPAGELTAAKIDRAALDLCPRCAALSTAGERLETCLWPHPEQPRCDIRLVEHWQGMERLVIVTLSHLDRAQPSPGALDLLNKFVVTTKALYPRLTLDDEGAVRQEYYADTLAGQVLRALVTLTAQRFGDVLHANIAALTVPECRRVAEEARKFYRQDRSLRLARRASYSSQRRVAREEAADRATIRRYMRLHGRDPHEDTASGAAEGGE